MSKSPWASPLFWAISPCCPAHAPGYGHARSCVCTYIGTTLLVSATSKPWWWGVNIACFKKIRKLLCLRKNSMGFICSLLNYQLIEILCLQDWVTSVQILTFSKHLIFLFFFLWMWLHRADTQNWFWSKLLYNAFCVCAVHWLICFERLAWLLIGQSSLWTCLICVFVSP